MLRPLVAATVTATAILATGCISWHLEHKVKVDEKSRVALRFEDPRVAVEFHKLVAITMPLYKNWEWDGILLVYGGGSETFDETSCYNAVARIVDANGDGIVTKGEVTSARDAIREAFAPKKHCDNKKDNAACPPPNHDGK